MNCEEFWGKATEYVATNDKLPQELNEHISHCSQCEKEFNLINQGLINLRKEIKEEAPAFLWHDMKENIGKNIKIPSKLWNFKNIWKFVLVPSGVAIALIFGFFFYYDKGDNSGFYPYDVPSLLSEAPLEDMLLQDNALTSNDKFDSEFISAFFGGITDEMSIVIIKNIDVS
jgi:hypothetical protein